MAGSKSEPCCVDCHRAAEALQARNPEEWAGDARSAPHTQRAQRRRASARGLLRALSPGPWPEARAKEAERGRAALLDYAGRR